LQSLQPADPQPRDLIIRRPNISNSPSGRNGPDHRCDKEIIGIAVTQAVSLRSLQAFNALFATNSLRYIVGGFLMNTPAVLLPR
jgi:hypothetical protein